MLHQCKQSLKGVRVRQCSARWKIQEAILMFKTLKNRAPEYLRNLFIDRNTRIAYTNASGKLNLLRPQTEYMKRSFATARYINGIVCPNLFIIKTIDGLPYGNLVKQYACDLDYCKK